MDERGWRGRRAAVAGGTGFLGRRVVERLRALGAEAVPVSRAAGCDLRDPGAAARALAEARPDVVFQCAGHQGGNQYQKVRAADLFLDNVLIGTNAFEAARRAGARRFVNVLPSCVYPGAIEGAMREGDVEAGPVHPSAEAYATAKRASLAQARAYRTQHGLSTVSPIVFNIYGPGDHFRPDRSHGLAALARRFFEARRDGAPEVVVWGTGRARREWIYVDDAAEAVVRAADASPDIEVVNVSTGRGATVAETAETIRRVLGYGGAVRYDPAKPEGALTKIGDDSRTRTALGWVPRTPLEEGIRRTAEWLEAHYAEAVGA